MPTVSYAAKITNLTIALKFTLRVYRDAVKYIINIVELHYHKLSGLKAQEAQRHIEKLIHTTDKNVAIYPRFDKMFYKFPSYYRREAISTAIGIYDSYRKLLKLWQDEGCKGKKPKLNRNQAFMPCFYRGNTFHDIDNIEGFQLKAYINKDWVWLPIILRETDLGYMRRLGLGKTSAPVLEKRHRGYALRFSFNVPKSEKKFVKDKYVKTAIGVDLGINTDAVCSCIDWSGTVTGCKFIDSPVEKDRMYRMLGHIKDNYAHGSYHSHRAWRFVDNYNKAIAIRTARGIVDFALKHNADVIVFEHLDIRKKLHGSKARRIALWRKREIQDRVQAMAQRHGIRIAFVSPKNTSALAYDGSGKVVRDKNNASLCTFTTGKRYNCDLSASKNIAARYFIRAIYSTITKKYKMLLEAKVPEVSKRTLCTLSTLISMDTVIEASAS